MSLDLDIQRLLRSNEVKQINFTMAGIHVSGHGYWELSNCFSDGFIRHRIRVTVRPALVGPHALAAYDPVDDKINLRSPGVLTTPAGRAQVVHECTHAQMDLRGVHASIRSEEAAAFIAEAWYLLASFQHINSVSPGFPPEIVTIAGNLREHGIRNMGRPAPVAADDMNAARRIMARGYRYPPGHYRSDGIGGHRYRGP